MWILFLFGILVLALIFRRLQEREDYRDLLRKAAAEQAAEEERRKAKQKAEDALQKIKNEEFKAQEERLKPPTPPHKIFNQPHASPAQDPLISSQAEEGQRTGMASETPDFNLHIPSRFQQLDFDLFDQAYDDNHSISYDNGDKYVGELNEKRTRHGLGKYYYAHGDIFLGDWYLGERTGYGIYHWTSGDIYEGYWIKGNMHGKGFLRYNTGDKYQGDFLNDVRHGYGHYWYNNGDQYEGDWLNGKRTGQGIYRFANGDQYQGGFYESVMHGKGVRTYKSGTVVEEFWDKGVQKK
jgi:hypothetical protein